MRTITELSDLIGDAELTEKYFDNYPRLKEKWSLPAVESCLIEILQKQSDKYSLDTIEEWKRRGYTIETLLDILPKGIIVPTTEVSGHITLKTADGKQVNHTFNCTTNIGVPIKRPKEIYLIFPLTIIGSVSYNANSYGENFTFSPVWDIIAVPNYLLADL